MDTKLNKVKRRTWSTSAVELFFEGLYQYGKDFPKILDHMQSKQKKSNVSIPPGLTYNQVRFFYYRTWHKVELLLLDRSEKKNTKPLAVVNESSVHQGEGSVEGPSEDEVQLDSSLDDVEDATKLLQSPKKSIDENAEGKEGEKGNRESAIEQTEVPVNDKTEKRKDVVIINGIQQSLDLVALICYWKLKKKHPAGDRGFGRKLSELVYSGTTTIPSRIKGKRRTQLKIPVCGALRQNTSSAADKGVAHNEIPEAKPAAPLGYCNRSGPVTEVAGLFGVPVHLSVEVLPLTLATWLHVQSKSLNPRIRISTNSSFTVEEIANFLTSRFSVDGLVMYCNKGFDFSNSNPECSGQDSSSGVYEDKRQLSTSDMLSDVYNKCGGSGVLRLSYEIMEHGMGNKYEDLQSLFRLVQFFKPKMQDKPKPTICSSPKSISSSPKVAEYLRTLPALSVRKSPISKYKKIRSQTVRKDNTKPEGESSNVVDEARPAVIASNYLKTRKVKPRPLNNSRTGVVRQLVPKPLPFLPESFQKRLEDLPARKMLEFSLLQKLQTTNTDGVSLLQGQSFGGPAKQHPQPALARTSAMQLQSISPSLQAITSHTLTSQPLQQVFHKPASSSSTAVQDHLMTSNIQEAVINEFLSTPLEQTDKEDQGQFSSSDTVNELLKGFAAPSPQEATQVLNKEIEEVLPSFSHALKQQFSLSEENKSEEGNLPTPKPKETEMMDCTAVLDDGTTDYIRKFKELASSMESSSHHCD